ncbi:MAG: hypothetical protein MUC88_20760 [Planctomycetes bacterium]|nr:hypothetical protein [Planctomycetota bacterium]
MPGKPKNHRAEWSAQELEDLRREVKFLRDMDKSVHVACKTLRYKFRRKPRALESMYYRILRRAQPATPVTPGCYIAIAKGGDREYHVSPTPAELLADLGDMAADMTKFDVYKATPVEVVRETTVTVKEV